MDHDDEVVESIAVPTTTAPWETHFLRFEFTKRVGLWRARRFAVRFETLSVSQARETAGTAVLKAPASDMQARGERILRALGEVNRYWLIAPHPAVRSYAYEFYFHDEPPTLYKVEKTKKVEEAVRQGIAYQSVMHTLARNPSAVTITHLEVDTSLIRIAFSVNDPRKDGDLTYGTGVTGSFYGYGGAFIEDGTIVIDASSLVPLTLRTNAGKRKGMRETFSEYVAVDESHCVPLRIRAFFHNWRFHWFKPGLWLFSETEHGRMGTVTINGTVAVPEYQDIRIE